jgi:hypothetical protein
LLTRCNSRFTEHGYGVVGISSYTIRSPQATQNGRGLFIR